MKRRIFSCIILYLLFNLFIDKPKQVFGQRILGFVLYRAFGNDIALLWFIDFSNGIFY